MEYTFKDGAKLRWNVLIPKEESVLDTYPDLAAIFEDMRTELMSVGCMSVDQIMRYLVLVYDTKSPLIPREENILARKKRAMMIIGMDIDDKGYFNERINNVIAGGNMPMTDLKMRYLRFQNSIVWMQLTNLYELFFENQRLIGQAISNDGKKSADEIMKVRLSTQKDGEILEQKMAKLADTLFVGDIDLLNFVGSTIVKDDIRNRLSMEARVSSRGK